MGTFSVGGRGRKSTFILLWNPDCRNAKSRFLRMLGEKARWRRSAYRDNLFYLERFIIEGVNSYASSLCFTYLKRFYPKEYGIMSRELGRRSFM
jgi:hypothetical protein